MPIAVAIREALPVDTPLLAAVQAIQSISATLAELASTRDLIHRDIKPENLYHYEGHWCIGDFGLVDDPDAETLTEVGKLLGARFYLAPELHRADNSSWAAADQYALAKTLWALITGQRFPPPGHLVRSVDYFRLGTYIQSDDSVRYIEALIERSTDPLPKARPSMMELSEELAAWLQPRKTLLPPSPSDVMPERVRSAVLGSQDVELERAPLKAYLDRRLAGLLPEIAKIGAVIKSFTDLPPQYGAFPEVYASTQVARLLHLADTYHVGILACRVRAPLKRRSGLVNYVAGIVLCITTSGLLHILVLHLCTASPNALVVPIWMYNASAQMGSFIEQQTLNELLAALLAKTPEALESFAHLIES